MQKWCLSVPLFLKGILTGSCFSGRCFNISKWIFSYALGVFQTASFVLAPRASESLCEPFNSEISVPYSPYGPLGYTSLVSELGILRAYLWWRSQELRCLMWITNPSFLRATLWDPSWLYFVMLRVGFLRSLCLSFKSWCSPFILCCGGAVQLVFGSFSGVILYVAVDFLCLWEEVSSDLPTLPSWTTSSVLFTIW